jgi:hypothetical protein
MKKLILLIILLILPSLALANDPDLTVTIGEEKETTAVVIPASPLEKVIDRIPELQNAVMWNWKTKEIDYAAMFNLLEWKGASFALGYTPAETLVFGLSYNLGSLENLGVKTVILKDIKLEPTVFYSLDRINIQDTSTASEGFAVGAKLLEVRFW